jgi:hypothetical protein
MLQKKELRISEEHQARQDREQKRIEIERKTRVADAHFDKIIKSYKRAEKERAAVEKADKDRKEERKKHYLNAGETKARMQLEKNFDDMLKLEEQFAAARNEYTM